MSPRRIDFDNQNEELPKIRIAPHLKREILKLLKNENSGYRYFTDFARDAIVEKLKRAIRNGKYRGKRYVNNGVR